MRMNDATIAESLESRRLLSAAMYTFSSDGVLTINGTDSVNSIDLSNNKYDETGEPTPDGIYRSRLVVDGKMQLFQLGLIKKVIARTGGGDDYVFISVQADVHSEYGMQVLPRSSPQSVSGVFQ